MTTNCFLAAKKTIKKERKEKILNQQREPPNIQTLTLTFAKIFEINNLVQFHDNKGFSHANHFKQKYILT